MRAARTNARIAPSDAGRATRHRQHAQRAHRQQRADGPRPQQAFQLGPPNSCRARRPKHPPHHAGDQKSAQQSWTLRSRIPRSAGRLPKMSSEAWELPASVGRKPDVGFQPRRFTPPTLAPNRGDGSNRHRRRFQNLRENARGGVRGQPCARRGPPPRAARHGRDERRRAEERPRLRHPRHVNRSRAEPRAATCGCPRRPSCDEVRPSRSRPPPLLRRLLQARSPVIGQG